MRGGGSVPGIETEVSSSIRPHYVSPVFLPVDRAAINDAGSHIIVLYEFSRISGIPLFSPRR